ncbi:MAG: phosphoesterase [bacterium]|nr:phosphoesterase [bacterium]
MKTIAIYHKDCADGTTAAAVVLKKFPNALLFPLSHGFKPEELEPIVREAKTGDQIYTVDCVLGAREFLAGGFKIISIDHHIGSEEKNRELMNKNKNFTFVFDNKKSGASLAWDYFFPEEKKPELIKLVEDRDLWIWKYGQKTKDVGNSLFMLVNRPDEVLKLFDKSLDIIEKEGAVISRFTNMIIEHGVKTTDPIMVRVGTYIVPFYNITINKSESGNILATEKVCAVGLFTIDGSEVKISFRSLDKQNPSALELALLLDGGGHQNASGAKMELADFMKSIVF